MPRAYSAELRADVLVMDAEGVPTCEIVVELNVSPAWVRRVKQEFREQGKTAPKTTRDRVRAWTRDGWAEWLHRTIDKQPDLYLHEIVTKLEAECGIRTDESTICRACKALGITRKKRR